MIFPKCTTQLKYGREEAVEDPAASIGCEEHVKIHPRPLTVGTVPWARHSHA